MSVTASARSTEHVYRHVIYSVKGLLNDGNVVVLFDYEKQWIDGVADIAIWHVT